MNDLGVQPAAAVTPGLSQWQRVANIFSAPSKTFEDIKRGNKSWWLPFLLFIVVGTGLWGTVTTQVTWPIVFQNGLKISPKQAERLEALPPEQREPQMKYGAIGQQVFWGLAPIWVMVSNLVAAGVLLGTINFGFGGKATFGQVLAVSWYAGLPGLIKLLLGIVGLWVGVAAESFLPGNPAGTNLGYYFVPPDTPIALWTILTLLDITILWTLVLFAKGLAKVAGTKPSAGYMAVFGWWIVMAIVQMGVAAAFS